MEGPGRRCGARNAVRAPALTPPAASNTGCTRERVRRDALSNACGAGNHGQDHPHWHQRWPQQGSCDHRAGAQASACEPQGGASIPRSRSPLPGRGAGESGARELLAGVPVGEASAGLRPWGVGVPCRGGHRPTPAGKPWPGARGGGLGCDGASAQTGHAGTYGCDGRRRLAHSLLPLCRQTPRGRGGAESLPRWDACGLGAVRGCRDTALSTAWTLLHAAGGAGAASWAARIVPGEKGGRRSAGSVPGSRGPGFVRQRGPPLACAAKAVSAGRRTADRARSGADCSCTKRHGDVRARNWSVVGPHRRCGAMRAHRVGASACSPHTVENPGRCRGWRVLRGGVELCAWLHSFDSHSFPRQSHPEAPSAGLGGARL